MSWLNTGVLTGFPKCSAITTPRESVKITDGCIFVSVMCSTVIKIPCASAVKILAFAFSVFVLVKLGPCAAHETAEVNFEASVEEVVYRYVCCKCRKCCKIRSLGQLLFF